MCRPDDYPPYPTAQRRYTVTYYAEAPGFPVRKVTVNAATPDDARAEAKRLDERFIATAYSPRIRR
jgi:hypothetical protein